MSCLHSPLSPIEIKPQTTNHNATKGKERKGRKGRKERKGNKTRFQIRRFQIPERAERAERGLWTVDCGLLDCWIVCCLLFLSFCCFCCFCCFCFLLFVVFVALLCFVVLLFIHWGGHKLRTSVLYCTDERYTKCQNVKMQNV